MIAQMADDAFAYGGDGPEESGAPGFTDSPWYWGPSAAAEFGGSWAAGKAKEAYQKSHFSQLYANRGQNAFGFGRRSWMNKAKDERTAYLTKEARRLGFGSTTKIRGSASGSVRAGFIRAGERTRLGVKAARGFARLSSIGTAMWIAPMLYGMTYHGFKGIQKLATQLARPELGGHLTLTAMAATDRQRSMQAMHNSEFNGRSAIGGEAFLMHQ